MGLLEKFKSLSRKEKIVGRSIEFTQEESEAIETYVDEMLANAKTETGKVLIAEKAYTALQAQALNQYANDLLTECNYEDRLKPESIEVATKIQQAKTKAYSLHNLPIFLFQIGASYLLTGDHRRARLFFKKFIKYQSEFRPDKVDQVLQAQMDVDIAEAIEQAREYIKKS